jgi:hypothetical protein
MRGGATLDSFRPEFKQFFTRYNEPSYIKSVKIGILTMLADSHSADSIIAELGEYVTDVDSMISREAVRAIGKIGVQVPTTAELIVGSLTNLLELDIDYVSTESAVVMKDLVRRYPEQFHRASAAVERCMKIVAEPEGKCALLWILGEYGEVIEDAPYILEPLFDGFLDESSGAVKLEMLTASMKLFFTRAPEMQKMLGRLLKTAIQESTDPDVRDRALLYYRLLEVSPDEARRVVCTSKAVVEKFREEDDADAKERLIEEFNTLGTVLKLPASKFVLSKVPSRFLGAMRMLPAPLPDGYTHTPQDDQPQSAHVMPADDSLLGGPLPTQPSGPAVDMSADLLGESFSSPAPATTAPTAPAVTASSAVDDLLGMGDLLGGDILGSSAPAAPAATAAPFALVPGAKMEGPVFEARWSQFQHIVPQQRQVRQMPAAPWSTSAIEEVLKNARIYVVASGVVPPNSMKFFLFGQLQPAALGSEVWFLCELSMTPGASAQCTLKAQNASDGGLVDAFYATLWQALAAYIT